jgi:hypothetical protein
MTCLREDFLQTRSSRGISSPAYFIAFTIYSKFETSRTKGLSLVTFNSAYPIYLSALTLGAIMPLKYGEMGQRSIYLQVLQPVLVFGFLARSLGWLGWDIFSSSTMCYVEATHQQFECSRKCFWHGIFTVWDAGMMLMLEGISLCGAVRRSSHITLAQGSNSCPVQITQFLTRLLPRTNGRDQTENK